MSGKKGGEEGLGGQGRGRQAEGRKEREASGAKRRRILHHYCFYTVSSSLVINKLICMNISFFFINSPTGLTFCGIFAFMTIAILLYFLFGSFKEPHSSKYSIKMGFITLSDPLKLFTLLQHLSALPAALIFQMCVWSSRSDCVT